MTALAAALLATVLVFLAAAFAAAYFRNWPHADAREQLALIANDRTGWTAQALLFPAALLATAVVFALIARRLPAAAPRALGLGGAALFFAGALLWLPISVQRLRYWPRAVALLQAYDPANPVDVNFGGQTFWAHTACVLAAITAMGAALALGGALPVLGWILAAAAAAGLAIGRFVWRDWPPFMSYVLLLVMAVGLLAA